MGICFQYSAIVMVLFIAEVVLGILIFVYTDEAEEILTKGMEGVFNDYGQQDEALTKSLDLAQQEVNFKFTSIIVPKMFHHFDLEQNPVCLSKLLLP